MKKILVLPLIFLCGVAFASPAGDAYNKAQGCYKELKADAKKAADSKNWARCIADFKAVAEQNPKDPKAPDALYSAARLSRELGGQEKNLVYIEESIHTYNALIKDYPDSPLADDALYQIGLLRHDPLQDDERAKKAFEAVVARYPKGDMAPKAKAELATLGAAGGVVEANVVEPVAAPVAAPAAAVPVKQDVKKEDRFRLSKLVGMKVDIQKTQTTITLELNQKTSFTKKFVEFGKRTKAPARLTLEFPKTKIAEGIKGQEAISSPHLESIKIKEGVFSGELILRFDLKENATYDVIQRDGKTTIRFFSQGTKPTLPPVDEKIKAVGKETASIRIVIDPGHGGKDTGAIGPNKIEEKTVTLAVAKKLAKDLQEKLGATVFLTRDKDKDLPLEKRNAFATAKKADLFISVHANANKNKKVSGIETYYLNNATDEAAKKLAQRENKSAAKPQNEVDQILLTLFQNYNTEESRVFADDVHKTMISRLQKRYKDLNDHKVRSALFYVLVGAKCPGILVETSFISNPVEAKRLTDPTYQQHVADAITAGVERYVKINKDRLATL